jgi:hypothetical protein
MHLNACREEPTDAHSGLGDFDDRDGLTAAPALAQTYNPDYPVCLQTYGIEGGYIECGYASLA